MLGSVLKDIKTKDDEIEQDKLKRRTEDLKKYEDDSSDSYTGKSVRSDDTNKKWKKETE